MSKTKKPKKITFGQAITTPIVFGDVEVDEIIISKNTDGSWVVQVVYSLSSTTKPLSTQKRITFREFTTGEINDIVGLYQSMDEKVLAYLNNL